MLSAVDLDLGIVHRRVIIGRALHVEAEILVGLDGSFSPWKILEGIIVDPLDEICSILSKSRRHPDGDAVESQGLLLLTYWDSDFHTLAI